VSVRSRTSPERLVWTFDRFTAVLAALFTLLTIYYAFYNLTQLSILGIDFAPYVPTALKFPERAKYVILFVGLGLAVYYFDYTRTELVDRMKSLLAPPFVMVIRQPSGLPPQDRGVRVAGCYLFDPQSNRNHFPA
jgi:succinate dehydrogenase hydrophobic anchor subunit